MTKNNDHCGCILPMNVVIRATCHIKMKVRTKSTTHALITSTFRLADVGRVDKLTARLTLGRFRRLVGSFMLV